MKIKSKGIFLTLFMSASLISTVKGMDQMIATEPTVHRVINQVETGDEDIRQILDELSLTMAGESISPLDGRIATNRIVPTNEKGNVVIRIYPSEMGNKLETGNLNFEVATLEHLSKQGINVPHVLQFKDGKYTFDLDGKTVVAYPLLDGKTVSKDGLSLETATLSGNFLASMVKASEKFEADKYESDLPTGDLGYIIHIYQERCKEIPDILKTSTYSEMLSFVQDSSTRDSIAKSPKGIVHADYFFENFVVNGTQSAAIDFGDAYYGAVAMDVAIGAMEFSAVSEEEWNFDYLRAFLTPIKPWLNEHKFTADDLINLMKANCLRFAIYTAPFTIEDGELLSDNPYAKRFKYLSKPHVQENIRQLVNSIN